MLKISVPHPAAPGGSKISFLDPRMLGAGFKQGWVRKDKSGHTWLRIDKLYSALRTKDSAKGNAAWRKKVEKCACEQLGIPLRKSQRDPQLLISSELIVCMEFHVPRPVAHYKKDGELSAEGLRNPFPTKKPDLTKLLRSTEDALTEVVWSDDAIIIDQFVHKRYVDNPEDVRVVINIFPAQMYEYSLSFSRIAT
jgi:Holliday junction resolvase RusA-like endonuclease